MHDRQPVRSGSIQDLNWSAMRPKRLLQKNVCGSCSRKPSCVRVYVYGSVCAHKQASVCRASICKVRSRLSLIFISALAFKQEATFECRMGRKSIPKAAKSANSDEIENRTTNKPRIRPPPGVTLLCPCADNWLIQWKAEEWLLSCCMCVCVRVLSFRH